MKTARGEAAEILALGDSYTIGEGIPIQESWPYQLADRLRERRFSLHPPTLLAETGWTTEDLLRAIEETELKANYDLVTLLIGVNDQYDGIPMDHYQEHFQEGLQRAILLSGGEPRRVIVLSIPDYSVTPFAQRSNREAIRSEIRQFNHVNRTLASQAGVQYIDVTAISQRAEGDPSLLAPDGLHPSGKMYAAWVDLLLPASAGILDAWGS